MDLIVHIAKAELKNFSYNYKKKIMKIKNEKEVDKLKYSNHL